MQQVRQLLFLEYCDDPHPWASCFQKPIWPNTGLPRIASGTCTGCLGGGSRRARGHMGGWRMEYRQGRVIVLNWKVGATRMEWDSPKAHRRWGWEPNLFPSRKRTQASGLPATVTDPRRAQSRYCKKARRERCIRGPHLRDEWAPARHPHGAEG